MKNVFALSIALSLILSFTSCGDDASNTKSAVHKELILQPDANEGEDAVINKNLNTLNYGDSTDLFLAGAIIDGRTQVTRILVDFDLRPIREYSVVDSAFISFYYDNTTTKGEHTGRTEFQLMRINERWKEAEVTWATQPTTSITNIVSVPGHTDATQNFERMDVKDLVQEMVDEQGFTWGFLAKFKQEDLGKQLLFASSDHPDASLRPKLEVYYTYYE
jgi:hypothetical protein